MKELDIVKDADGGGVTILHRRFAEPAENAVASKAQIFLFYRGDL